MDRCSQVDKILFCIVGSKTAVCRRHSFLCGYLLDCTYHILFRFMKNRFPENCFMQVLIVVSSLICVVEVLQSYLAD